MTRTSRAATASAALPRPLSQTGTVRFNPRGLAMLDLDGPDAGTLRLTRKEARPLLDGDRVVCESNGPERSLTVTARPRTVLVGVVVDSDRGPVLEIDPAVGSSWVMLPKAPYAPGTAIVVELKPSLTSRLRAARVLAGPWPAYSLQHLRTAAFLRTTGRYPVLSPHADPQMLNDRILSAITGRHPRISAEPVPARSPRADLRALGFVTIDGPETRDIDDAVWAATSGAGWEVKVAIADVASAVPQGSELDEWALAAATSVYLPGEVHPMLPPSLSEDRCSLLPGRDRDTVVVSFSVSPDGEVSDVSLTLATICSKARLTYDQVDVYLSDGNDPSVPETVTHCAAAAEALGRARSERSELPEMITPVLAEPVVRDGVVTVERVDPATASHRLIEELMIAANEAVGSFIASRGATALYRRQRGPAADPLTSELASIAELWADGDPLPADPGTEQRPDWELTAADVATLLAGLPADAAAAGSSRVLRHLGRAFYAEGPGGHFHLGATHYLHFTSPIRRFADLVVHRVVHALLAGDELPYSAEELSELGAWVTARSAAADWAEAGCQRSLWAVLLDAKIRAGEKVVAVGVVSQIDRRGAMLRLPRFGVSCRVGADEFGTLDASADGLSAQLPDGSQIRVGDEVSVSVTAADLLSGDLTVALRRR